MLEAINSEIELIQKEKHRQDRIRSHVLRNNRQLTELHNQQALLEKILEKEHRDVLILENQTVWSVFYTILGSKEMQLEIERQEYLMELLKYNELLDTIDLLEYENDLLKETVSQIQNQDERMTFLMQKKERIMKEKDKKFSIKITLLDQSLRTLQQKVNESISAVEDAEQTAQLLVEIRNELQKVKDWGTWHYYGSGRNSAYTKKSFIDDARKKAIKANHYLETLENQLKQIFIDFEIPEQLRLNTFDQFLKTFYDNLITDWIVQQQIKNTMQNIQSTIDKISRIVGTVDSEKRKIITEIEKLKKKRSDLVLKA